MMDVHKEGFLLYEKSLNITHENIFNKCDYSVNVGKLLQVAVG